MYFFIEANNNDFNNHSVKHIVQKHVPKKLYVIEALIRSREKPFSESFRGTKQHVSSC